MHDHIIVGKDGHASLKALKHDLKSSPRWIVQLGSLNPTNARELESDNAPSYAAAITHRICRARDFARARIQFAPFQTFETASHSDVRHHRRQPRKSRSSKFIAVDIRVGTIVKAEPFPEARKPALRLFIDFGPAIGVKKSSAQLTKYYAPETLVGRQVAAPSSTFRRGRSVPLMSEVLTLGFPDAEGAVVLIGPERQVPDGGRMF